MTDENRLPASLGGTPRRTFLTAVAGTGVAAGFSGVLNRQEDAETFEFQGHFTEWLGDAPDSIAGAENPTLELEPGTTYRVVWENADGLPHNFVIVDADARELVRSEVIAKKGVTQTVEFEATEEMAEYLCEYHPRHMRGDIRPGGEEPSDPEDEQRIPTGESVGLETVAEGFAAPLGFEVAPEEADRRFILDQTGQVYVHDDAGLREEPFLDVGDRLVDLGDPTLGGYDERGLLGLAFHPGFQENGRFFVHYSAPNREGTPEQYDHTAVISEFAATEDLASADPDTERTVLEVPSPQMNHNGARITFGPDGYLYVPIGDGGARDDVGLGHVEDWYDANEGGNGQNVTENLLGGVHRIDVDSEGSDAAYGVPEDNPLVGEDGLDEYYAWGFRNPHHLSFDSEGRLLVADAGQNLWEEVNLVEKGGNYGWNVKEATHCFSTDNPVEAPEECPDHTPDGVRGGEPLLDPVVEYPHRDATQAMVDGSVVMGGYVYETDEIDHLEGKYVFGNWSARGVVEPLGQIFVASPEEVGKPPAEDTGEGPTGTPSDTPTGTPTDIPTDTSTGTSTDIPTGTSTGTPTETSTGTSTNASTGTPTNASTGTPTDAPSAAAFELGGRTAAWQGRSPSEIEGASNPTLSLIAGESYEVTWENVDGAPHNFAILDAEGNTLVSSEIIDGEGATQTVEFEATEEMAGYLCEVHPQTMRGAIEMAGGAAGGSIDGALPSHDDEALWAIEELVIDGTESERLDGYLYGFGRGENGDLYVLTSENAVPFGDTGAVHRIVPAGDDGDDDGSDGDDDDGADGDDE